jgi:hypothetical protein
VFCINYSLDHEFWAWITIVFGLVAVLLYIFVQLTMLSVFCNSVSAQIGYLCKLYSETAGLLDQTSDQDRARGSSDHSFDNIGSEGTSRMVQEFKPFWRKLPSMDPCLCCYCFYSHEEENWGLFEKAWLVKHMPLSIPGSGRRANLTTFKV